MSIDWKVVPGLEERFWEKVRKSDGCWEWEGATRNRMGHGHIWVEGRTEYVHRLSYEMHVGPIPEGMCVCHHCDNPPCVRPDHLFLGTKADNVADMFEKGRDQQNPVTGIEHHKAKLTDAEVAEIREAVAGDESQRSIARRYGVSQATVWRICKGIGRTGAQ